VIAFTAGQAADRRGVRRLIIRYQAYLFFPLLLAEAVSMHLISIWAVLHGTGRPGRRGLEGALLLVHFAGYLTVVALVMSPAQAIAFIVVQQGLTVSRADRQLS
jgi:hypothetical protein